MSELALAGVSRDTVKELIRYGSEPDWLAEIRLKAWEVFEKTPLELSSMYVRHTDLRSVNLSSLEVLPSPSGTAKLPASLDAYVRDSGENSLHLQVDSALANISAAAELADKKVVFTDISTAVKRHRDLIEPYLRNRAIKAEEDKLVALNTALFGNGVFLHVPDGIQVETPIRSVKAASKPGVGVFNLSVIVMGVGSKATFVEEGYSGSEHLNGVQSLQSNVLEIYLGEGAELDTADIQSFGGNVVVFTNRRALSSRDSSLNWVGCALGGRFMRANTSAILDGPGSNVQQVEVVFGSGEQQFDMASTLNHIGQHTTGDIYSTGVFKDKSKGVFKGMIKIAKSGISANSFLSEHSLLLNPQARADAIPALEIETNEVKCSHSASVAQIDQEQIFYMMTRGLDEQTARATIVEGFFESALRKVQLPELKKRVGGFLEEKWKQGQ